MSDGKALRKDAAIHGAFVSFTFDDTAKPAILATDILPEKVQRITVSLHCFCAAEDLADVEVAIREMIAEPNCYQTKEAPRLAASLFGEYRPEYHGTNGGSTGVSR